MGHTTINFMHFFKDLSMPDILIDENIHSCYERQKNNTTLFFMGRKHDINILVLFLIFYEY